MASETTPGTAGAAPAAEMKAVFDQHRQLNWLLGGLMVVTILGAIPAFVAVGMAVNLVWGALAFGGCLAAFFATLIAFFRWLKKKDQQATAAVRDIEQRHGLTLTQSLDVFWSEGYRLADTDRAAFFKPFVHTIWGKEAYEQTEERVRNETLAKYNIKDKSSSLPAPVYLSYFACGYCHKPVAFERGRKIVCQGCNRTLQLRSLAKCPKCKERPELVDELVGGVAGELVGTAVLGAAGGMIGKAMAGKMSSVYACRHCSHRFGMELLEQTDLEIPSPKT